MIIELHRRRPATLENMRRNVHDILRRRAAEDVAPVNLVITDASALTIACLFRSRSGPGLVLDQLARGHAVDSDALIEAARDERDLATVVDQGALRCLITWAEARAATRRRR